MTLINEYKSLKCKLDGMDSISIPIEIKMNGEYITDTVDIIAKGFLKFSDSTDDSIEKKEVVYPVLFSSERIRVTDGRGVITLLPRSEDVFEETSKVVSSVNIYDDYIVNNIKRDEEINDPDINPVIIKIESGVTRYPYKISVEVTVFSEDGETIYLKTIDRGTSPTIDSVSPFMSMFKKSVARTPSNIIIDYYNDTEWVPVVESVLNNNSSTKEEVLEEIGKMKNLTPFGLSTMSDAVIKSSEILSSVDVNDFKKTVYLFTDNESNVSKYSLDDAVSSVNDVDASVMIANVNMSNSQALSIRANNSDTNSLNKLSFLTGGQALTVTDSNYVDDVVSIFYRSAVGAVGYGSHGFVVDMGEEILINSMSLSFYIPNEANAKWDIEYSVDGFSYIKINKSYLYSESISFDDTRARYIKFNIVLISAIEENVSSSEVPYLNYISILYNSYKVSYLYLKKDNDGISPYHMTVAVDSNVDDNNKIEVGLSLSDSNNWEDFSRENQPSVVNNGKIVVPVRLSKDTDYFSQEPLYKIDNFVLKTKYGSFDKLSSVTIYDKDDEVISSDSYKVISEDGVIVFNYFISSDYQSGDYKISIINNSDYKLGLKITNKNKDNGVDISGIGYLYSTDVDLLPSLSKSQPEARTVSILNTNLNKSDTIEMSYSYYDKNYDSEDLSKRKIKWFINNNPISFLDDMTKFNDIYNIDDPLYKNTSLSYPTDSQLGGDTIETWIKKQDDSIVKSGDVIYCEVQVSDGSLYSEKVRSNSVIISNFVPFIESLTIKAIDSQNNVIDRISSENKVVIYPELKNVFYSDNIENSSEIIWYVNDEVFKSGVFGQSVEAGQPPIHEIWINEVGTSNFIDYGLRMNNTIQVSVVPISGGIYGDIVSSPTVSVKNSLPKIYNLAYVNKSFDDKTDIVISWQFYDFEITALKNTDSTFQEDRTIIKWYRKKAGAASFDLVYSYNEGSTKELFYVNEYKGNIKTNIGTHSSVINSKILSYGQQWYAIVIPNDFIESGVQETTKIITISSARK